MCVTKQQQFYVTLAALSITISLIIMALTIGYMALALTHIHKDVIGIKEVLEPLRFEEIIEE